MESDVLAKMSTAEYLQKMSPQQKDEEININEMQQVGKKNKITYALMHLSFSFKRLFCNQTR